MHKLGLILVIIGTALVALDWILGFGPYPARGRQIGLLHIGVALIGIGVMIGVKTLT